MNNRIIVTGNFEKRYKKLKKKYRSLSADLALFEKQLLHNPHLGTPLGKNTYKIRLAVKSKGKGKSGGMRIISYVELDFFIADTTNIYLLTIYDKSETDSISKEDISKLIELR